MSEHYDVIVIGSGPGGGSVVHRLAPTGKRILLLERGDYLPRSPRQLGFANGICRRRLSGDRDLVRRGRPQLSSRAALLCRRQFQGLRCRAVSDAANAISTRSSTRTVCRRRGQLKYDAFEPYYAEAERLFHVHGQRGEDPTEPPSSGPFPLSAGFARAADCRRLPRAWPRTACIRFICRSESCSTKRTARRRRPASAFAATPSTAFPAC